MTLWGIGMVMLLFMFGGLVVDTWRVFAERQELAGIADSAAIAGATAIDVDHFRDTGEVILDEGVAANRAQAYVADAQVSDSPVTWLGGPQFPPGGMVVTLQREVGWTFLDAFTEGGSITVTVSAYAEPGERIAP